LEDSTARALLWKNTAALNAQASTKARASRSREDVRFTSKGDTLFAIFLERPADGKVTVNSLAAGDGTKPALLDCEIAA